MKRELKGLFFGHWLRMVVHIARPIPMKRELKGMTLRNTKTTAYS